MSSAEKEMLFAKTHEWLLLDNQGVAKVGITDYAQHTLGDVVYIELPEVGTQVKMGDRIALVESVKSASDIYSPISGEVMAVNEALVDSPDTVNTSPFAEGWLYLIKPSASEELDDLMDADAYKDCCE